MNLLIYINSVMYVGNCMESHCLKRSFCDADNNAVIEIKDEGEGISPDDIPHVTEPFFTKRREKGGTGLGLSITSNIINMHKGKLLFDSKVSKGTTVKIVIPA